MDHASSSVMTYPHRSMIHFLLSAALVVVGCSGDRSPSVDEEERPALREEPDAPVIRVVPPPAPANAAVVNNDAALAPVSNSAAVEGDAVLVPSADADTGVPTVAGADGVSILLADFGDGVDARILQHPGSTFSKAQASRVYLWFRVGNAQKVEQDLSVIWESVATGKRTAPITLHVKPMATFTTWAYMSTARKPGAYRALVTKADGTVLLTRRFELTE